MYKGQIDQAIELHQKSVDLEPDSPVARFYLINALLEAGNEARARIVADEIRAIDDTFSIAMFVREFSHDKNLCDRLKANLESLGFVE